MAALAFFYVLFSSSALGLRGVSLAWLVTSNISLVAMIAFTVVYGLDFIAMVPPTVRLTVTAYGREMGPAVFGWMLGLWRSVRA